MTSLALAAFALVAMWIFFGLAADSGTTWKGLLLATTSEDADMKIAPRSFSGGRREETAGQDEAENYLRQKSAGNIELARELGERFAALLMAEASGNFDPWPAELAGGLRAHHRLLLLTYVVNRAVAELSPNSILAQTTLNVFYSELEEKAPQLDKYIRDMGSYSLYVLCERSHRRTDDEIGKIYAGLCADKDNSTLIEEGNRCYHEYYTACKELHNQARYARV
ncbi:MAG: hypothetical protein FWE19_07220 [Oscillospiraceae bacterium]|nr:hypothetical protein [Oscillospiraceae bacterium]